MEMNGLTLAEIDDCIISTVVPQSLFNLRNFARRYLKVEPMVIGENVDLGIEGADPEAERGRRRPAGQRRRRACELSRPADRDRQRHRDDVRHRRRRRLVRGRHHRAGDQPVDAGAARGGGASCRAWQSRSRRSVIGKDTVEAMQSGIFWGYIDLIDGLVARIKAEYGKPMTVIATGGVASLFEGAATQHRPLRQRPHHPRPAHPLRAQHRATRPKS